MYIQSYSPSITKLSAPKMQGSGGSKQRDLPEHLREFIRLAKPGQPYDFSTTPSPHRADLPPITGMATKLSDGTVQLNLKNDREPLRVINPQALTVTIDGKTKSLGARGRDGFYAKIIRTVVENILSQP